MRQQRQEGLVKTSEAVGMASCGGSGGFRDQDSDREKIQKRLREMLMYLTLQGNLNQQPSSDGPQAEGGQSQLYTVRHSHRSLLPLFWVTNRHKAFERLGVVWFLCVWCVWWLPWRTLRRAAAPQTSVLG